MATFEATTTLHVFPMYGDWVHTDEVMVVTTIGDLPISEAYDHMVYRDGEIILSRDHVFNVIHLSEFRNRYDDVIMYAEPYSEMWCDDCDCPRFPVVTQFGTTCDACGASMQAPF